MKLNDLQFLKRILTSKILAVLMILLISVSMTQAAIVTTTGNGSWNSTIANTPWPGGIVPLNNDEVIIATGHTVEVTADAQIKNLTIQTGAFLNVGGFDFTVTGTTWVAGKLTHNSTAGTKRYTGLVTKVSHK